MWWSQGCRSSLTEMLVCRIHSRRYHWIRVALKPLLATINSLISNHHSSITQGLWHFYHVLWWFHTACLHTEYQLMWVVHRPSIPKSIILHIHDSLTNTLQPNIMNDLSKVAGSALKRALKPSLPRLCSSNMMLGRRASSKVIVPFPPCVCLRCMNHQGSDTAPPSYSKLAQIIKV